MPYVNIEQRKYLDRQAEDFSSYITLNDLSVLYCFLSDLVEKLFDRKPSYKAANQLLGVLEAISEEFIRRRVIPLGYNRPFLSGSNAEYIIRGDTKQYLSFNVGDVSAHFSTDEPGNLNYYVSKNIWKMFDRDPSQQAADDLVLALEMVKKHFYRDRVGPYENRAIARNGDL